jgi:hypothetical protein
MLRVHQPSMIGNLFLCMYISDGLQEHLDRIQQQRQSLRVILQTVSAHHADYLGDGYTCPRRSFLYEQRVSRLLNMIRAWFFTAAEDNFAAN